MQKITKYILTCVALALIVVLMISCAHVFTKEFILSKESKLVALKGWNLEPEIFAYKNVGGSKEPSRNRYIIEMHAYCPRKNIDSIIYDIDLDTLNFIFYPIEDTQVVILNRKRMSSLASPKNIRISFRWLVNKYQSHALVIPDTVDSLDVVFTATVARGVLWTMTKSNSSVEYDDIFVEDDTQRERIPMRMRLYRHQTKHPCPAFIIGH